LLENIKNRPVLYDFQKVLIWEPLYLGVFFNRKNFKQPNKIMVILFYPVINFELVAPAMSSSVSPSQDRWEKAESPAPNTLIIP